MTPEEARARIAAGPGTGRGIGKIDPEMRALLIKQAGEAAEEQTANEIDAHNAKIERQERHAEEVRALHDKSNTDEKKGHHRKGHPK